MRYPASEKAEIIRLVEQSALPVNRTLEKLGWTCPVLVERHWLIPLPVFRTGLG